MRLVTENDDNVEGEIFVHLDIIYAANEEIKSLDGTWYDLQGKFSVARKNMAGGEAHCDLPSFGDIKFRPYLLEHATTPDRSPVSVAA
jgi:hypothetical protein